MSARDCPPACIFIPLDSNQPRLAEGIISRWRTYAGLKNMSLKLDRLLSEFSFSTIGSVYPIPEIMEAHSKAERGD